MEFSGLRALRELQDRGSVVAVAQSLHVTPSAISQQLAALQRAAGIPLTRKRGRVLELTDAGRQLAGAAVAVSSALAQAENAISEFQADENQIVTVSAFHSAGTAWFGPLIAQLREADGPAVSCSDEDVAQQEFPTLTVDHDIVIAHRLPGSPQWPSSVASTALAFEPLDVALPATHRLAGQRSVTPAQLRDERWIAVHDGFPLMDALNTIGAMAGASLSIAHRINDFFTAASIVRAGDAVALLPRYTGAQRARSGVVLRPIRGVRLGRHIDALIRPESAYRASVRAVVKAIIAVVGAESNANASLRDGAQPNRGAQPNSGARLNSSAQPNSSAASS
ncbi:LysR family transcriptional regulator [Rathayibacter soli]|uniref:LysR family transcriptional regulator n=1 Tax=Rathayibacter soli TaxID=3144168 RepID=UPI0027E3D186|nr:LysR family transcriptional regulator [Glaciibacter superstes]